MKVISERVEGGCGFHHRVIEQKCKYCGYTETVYIALDEGDHSVMLRCLHCSRLTIQRCGWSDQTWDGRELQCQVLRFPHSVDEDYTDSIFDIAEQCPYFVYGNPVEISVEGEVLT